MPTDPRCTLCRLCQGRTQVVPPHGDPGSPLLLIGEGPGEREDRLGVPFVGRAGKWLDKCMEQAQLRREQVLITNTVRCRPPQNRKPLPDEMEACRRYLLEELPDRALIVPLGATATENLLGRPVRMGDEANIPRVVRLEGLTLMVMPTYHPSACIYNKEARVRLAEGLAQARSLSGLA